MGACMQGLEDQDVQKGLENGQDVFVGAGEMRTGGAAGATLGGSQAPANTAGGSAGLGRSPSPNVGPGRMSPNGMPPNGMPPNGMSPNVGPGRMAPGGGPVANGGPPTAGFGRPMGSPGPTGAQSPMNAASPGPKENTIDLPPCLDVGCQDGAPVGGMGGGMRQGVSGMGSDAARYAAAMEQARRMAEAERAKMQNNGQYPQRGRSNTANPSQANMSTAMGQGADGGQGAQMPPSGFPTRGGRSQSAPMHPSQLREGSAMPAHSPRNQRYPGVGMTPLDELPECTPQRCGPDGMGNNPQLAAFNRPGQARPQNTTFGQGAPAFQNPQGAANASWNNAPANAAAARQYGLQYGAPNGQRMAAPGRNVPTQNAGANQTAPQAFNQSFGRASSPPTMGAPSAPAAPANPQGPSIQFVGVFKDSANRTFPGDDQWVNSSRSFRLGSQPDANVLRQALTDMVDKMRSMNQTEGYFSLQYGSQMYQSLGPDRSFERIGPLDQATGQGSNNNLNLRIDGFNGLLNVAGGQWQNAVYRITTDGNAPAQGSQPAAARSPQPAASRSPQPAAARSPQPQAATSPIPQATRSPQPAAARSPQPVSSPQPPMTSPMMSPQPETNAAGDVLMGAGVTMDASSVVSGNTTGWMNMPTADNNVTIERWEDMPTATDLDSALMNDGGVVVSSDVQMLGDGFNATEMPAVMETQSYGNVSTLPYTVTEVIEAPSQHLNARGMNF